MVMAPPRKSETMVRKTHCDCGGGGGGIGSVVMKGKEKENGNETKAG